MSVSEKAATAETGHTVVPSTIRISRTVKIGSTGDEAMSGEVEKEIEVFVFPPGVYPAYVNVEVPVKKAHNYNSAGITIGVRRPCLQGEEPEAIKAVYELVKEALLAELPEIIKALHDLSA
jgi:hypothetical protein